MFLHQTYSLRNPGHLTAQKGTELLSAAASTHTALGSTAVCLREVCSAQRGRHEYSRSGRELSVP